MERFEPGTPGKEPIWHVVLMFPLSLGILAAGVIFLVHALFAEKPPGTTVVNPGFSLMMLAAGGFGLYAGCLSVFRRLFPARPAPPAAPAPPAPVERRPAETGQEIPGGRMPE